jgi:hypothetical protein
VIASVLYSNKGADGKALKSAGEAIARGGHELLFIPGKASATIAKAYKAAGGKRTIAFFPKRGDFGTKHIDEYAPLADERITNVSWPEADCEITKRADVVVVLGIDAGTLIELGFVKYNYKFFRKPKKLVIVGGVKLPLVLEECFKEIGIPVERATTLKL